jgi:membrane protein YqaA with SNARE-associated domain
MGNKVHSPHANIVLGILFYIEALFFLPTDPILILYCLYNRKKSLLYATIATVCSVAGGITGYWLGFALWSYAGQEILDNRFISYILPYATFDYLRMLYQKYQNWAILIASFTPIPYKAATLSAGFCNLAFIPFVLCSIIGRGGRFYVLAIIIRIWGKPIKNYIDRYFNTLALFCALFVGLIMWLIRK